MIFKKNVKPKREAEKIKCDDKQVGSAKDNKREIEGKRKREREGEGEEKNNSR